MKLSLILAAGALAVGTVATVPADAQRWHDRGHHDDRGYGHGGPGWRDGGHGRDGYGYHRGWRGGHHGRLVCRYRYGHRRCFRV
ncbi:hypothetical protein [Sphingomonas sp. CROZ-RG-20F-R02-07]|uniref:hypothetical protein n=1 Tax=Sphingomonas sp. CROZ-RG-20F-R02-07 TaxID=2914832 RepID=UPI001F589E8B|nr:hypothetical protein [Sphingomonas sp. CROZ-RG-20F-R02-07]